MARPEFATDISREEFEAVRGMLEAARRKTRPRKHDLYDVFNAMLYFLDTGAAWRSLPKAFPPWRTVHEYFTQWTMAREGERSLLELALEKAGRPKELARLKSKLASSKGDDLLNQAVNVGDIKVLAASIEGVDARALRETLDQIKDKLKSCAAVLATVEGDRVALIAGVSSDLTDRIKAGELVNFVATQVGGKGGGRADMAQAGGSNPAALPQALAGVSEWVRQKAG